MLIGTNDIIRYSGDLEIPQLGGDIIKGYGEIAMSKETGVVFIAQFIGSELDKFTVGAFNKQGLLAEKKDYPDKTEKDFFQAVKYFEELIKERQPEEEETPPSVGKFYFFKKSIGKDAYVAIEGMADIIIDAVDIAKVFSPPKTKPLGRLNLKDSTNPKYDPIKAKFALKYLSDECKEMATANNWDISDFAIYNMTPYEVGDENQGEPPPENVNPVNPNDIEDEDLEKKPKEKKEKKDKQDKNDKNKKDEPKDEDGEPGDEDGEPKDKDGEPGEKDGEPSDKDGEPTDKDGKPTDKDGEPSDKDGQPSDKDAEPTDKDSEPGDDDGEPEENDKEVKDREIDIDEIQSKLNKQENDKKKNKIQIEPKDLKDGLELFTNTSDLKRSFRKQKNLINTLLSYSDNELDKLLKELKLPNMNKQEFINLMEKETKIIFN